MNLQIATQDDVQNLRDDIARLTRLFEAQLANPQPMTVKEYAAEMGVSEATVRRWCRQEKINAERVGDKVWRIYEVVK